MPGGLVQKAVQPIPFSPSPIFPIAPLPKNLSFPKLLSKCFWHKWCTKKGPTNPSFLLLLVLLVFPSSNSLFSFTAFKVALMSCLGIAMCFLPLAQSSLSSLQRHSVRKQSAPIKDDQVVTVSEALSEPKWCISEVLGNKKGLPLTSRPVLKICLALYRFELRV